MDETLETKFEEFKVFMVVLLLKFVMKFKAHPFIPTSPQCAKGATTVKALVAAGVKSIIALASSKLVG